MSIEILVITEGATEREVGKALYEKGVLSPHGKPQPPEWKGLVGSREGYENVIRALREKNPVPSIIRKGQQAKVLLIFDQENSPTPQTRKDKIETDLKAGAEFWTNISFSPVDGYNNLFEYCHNELHIVLHVSSPGISGLAQDFDGYLIQLLQGSSKHAIVARMLPKSQRGKFTELLNKAEVELTELMKKNSFPWTHTKSWLYAYITVFQYRTSHVWFAAEVVKHAANDELKTVFSSLVAAWDRLIQGC